MRPRALHSGLLATVVHARRPRLGARGQHPEQIGKASVDVLLEEAGDGVAPRAWRMARKRS